MKLIDLLKVMHKDTLLTVEIFLYDGLHFRTRHSAERFLKRGAELNGRDVDMAYIANGEFCVRLKD